MSLVSSIGFSINFQVYYLTKDKVNDKSVKPANNLILKISFLTLFGCAVKITVDINKIYG